MRASVPSSFTRMGRCGCSSRIFGCAASQEDQWAIPSRAGGGVSIADMIRSRATVRAASNTTRARLATFAGTDRD